MKQNMYKHLKYSALVFCLLFVAGLASAQGSEKEKRVSKSYKVNDNRLEFSVRNKFGKVEISTWDKPQIDVEVVIKVDNRNESRAMKMLDQINVTIMESSQAIAFETRIDGSLNNRNNEEFEINYTIKMPSNLPLTVKNSFGDTYIGSYDGPATLDIAYGNIKAETFSNDLRLELSFGSGDITSTKKTDMTVKYSKLDIGKVGNATINSQFSDLDIEELLDVNLDAKYGSVEFGSLNNITGRVSFSGFELDLLRKSMDLTTSYSGDFTVRKVTKGFQRISLDGKFGSFDIGLESGANASVEANLKYCDMSYSGVPFEFNYVVKDHNSKEYRGKLGTGQGGTINVSSDYGDVRVRTVQ
ncbi:hypothetical protein RT717_02570 [Imperialibacter roseus]|uniref:Adhesin domain-containing protein n=1 Tax=Imperialibacter roseus TaxID=1324217 RepID=A0ABZ0ISY5_9BACT|nr:hypothetical protein [Imperialibacter roseus]WOK07505.1 hypothetical protein RT717_02570 [Imperialibacter roseus]